MPSSRQTIRMISTRAFPLVLLCGYVFCSVLASELPQKVERVQSGDVFVPHRIAASTSSIQLQMSDSMDLQFPDWLTHVRCRDAGVARVSAVSPDRICIERRSAGNTVVTARDRRGQDYRIEVLVAE